MILLRLFGHGGVAGLCRLGVLFGRRIGFICVARMNGLIIVYVIHGNKDEKLSTLLNCMNKFVYVRIPFIPGDKIRGVDSLFIL